MKKKWLILGWAALVFLPLRLGRADTPLLVNGAGATFPYPLYSKWFYEHHKKFPNIQFNYQSIGSGGGIRQITAGTVDFGASDAPMSDAELSKLPGPILHLPTVVGSVVIAYNQPRIGKGLRLTGSIVAEIFLGKIKKWNDPKIAAVNPGKALPDQAIFVAHRSDGSGTTYVFTDYLSKVSPEWKTRIGTGKAVAWPTGLGGKGNEGVTGLIKQTPGSLGYVELSYALENKLATAAIQNRAGKFVLPTIEATSQAAAGAKLSPDYRASITDSDGAASYPICAFTYLLVYQNQKDEKKGKALVAFLRWALNDGQEMAPPLYYAPLPKPVIARLQQTIGQIRLAESPKK